MKKKFEVLLVSVGLFSGLLLTWQLQTRVPIESSFPTDEINTRENLIKSYLDEQSYLQSRIVSLRKQIEDAENLIEDHTQTVNFEIIEELKKDIGLTEVKGEGLEIIMGDMAQASDIRDLVNILNAASAEAISINGQRMISNSSISSVGTTILINNAHIAPPFLITAVGDSDLMLQRLLDKSLLPSIYKKLEKGMKFEVYKKNRVSVPIYNGDLKANYINLVE